MKNLKVLNLTRELLVYAVILTFSHNARANQNQLDFEAPGLKFSDLPGEIIFEILRYVEYSNSDLVTLAKDTSDLRKAAQYLMAERLQRWTAQDTKFQLKIPRQKHWLYYEAMDSMWRKGTPERRSYHLEDANSHSSEIIAYDTVSGKHRVITLEKSAQEARLRLWNIVSGERQVLKRWPVNLTGKPTAHFLKWDTSKVLIKARRQLDLIDLSDSTKNISLSTNLGILQAIVDQRQGRVIYRDWGNRLYARDLRKTSEAPMSLHQSGVLRLFDIDANNSDSFYTQSDTSFEIWNKQGLRKINTLRLKNPVRFQGFVHPQIPDRLFVLSEDSRLALLDTNNSKILSETTISEECKLTRKFFTFSQQANQVILVCSGVKISIYDSTTLRELASINTAFQNDIITTLPGKSNWLINWSPGKSQIRVIDSRYSRVIAHLGRTCHTNYLSLMCQDLGVFKAQDYTVSQLIVNPWQEDRFLTSNGKNLILWDLEQQKAVPVANDFQTAESGHIYQYKSNPFYVLHLQSDGNLTVFDFWNNAKREAEENYFSNQ